MKYYDAVISLGQRCPAATMIERCNMRDASYPFDWIAFAKVKGKENLSGKIDIILNDFKDFFNYNNFIISDKQLSTTKHLFVLNQKTGLRFLHDFKPDKTLEEQLPYIKEKYDRRIKRLYDTVNSSDKILFVFIGEDEDYEDDFLIEQHKRLQEKFPNTKIDLLCFLYNETFKYGEYKKRILNSWVTRYDINILFVNNPDMFGDMDSGNSEIYYKLMKEFCYTPQTVLNLVKDKENYEKYERQIAYLYSKLEKRNNNNIMERFKMFFKRKKISHYFKIKTSTNEFNERIKNLFDELKGKRVLLYGAGVGFVELNKKYKFKENLNIVAIADKKFEKYNKGKFEGIKAIEPLETMFQEFDYILVTNEYYSPIVKFLKKNLINEDKIKTIFKEEIKDEGINTNYLRWYNFDKKLPKLIKKLKNKKILMYGAGCFSELIFKNYDLNELNIIGFADKRFNDIEGYPEFLGYKTYNPDDIKKLNPDYVIVATKQNLPVINSLYKKYLKNTNIKIKHIVSKNIKDVLKERIF